MYAHKGVVLSSIVTIIIVFYANNRYLSLDNVGTQSNDNHVRILTNKTDLEAYLSSTNTKGTWCTLDFLKQKFLKSKIFYGRGRWFAPPDGSASAEVGFFPLGCRFPISSFSTQALNRCGLKHVLVTGDSNARHITQRLQDSIQTLTKKGNGMNKCETVRSSAKDDTGYFATNIVSKKNLVSENCGYKKATCASWTIRCPVDINASISLEYMQILHLMDPVLHVHIDDKSLTDQAQMSAESKMEYLLKHYFPFRGFPDIWIFRPPLHHEAWRNSLVKMELDWKYTLGLLDMYLPNTTTIIFMSASLECSDKNRHAETFRRYWKQHINERIEQMNQLLYKVLLPDVTRKPNYYVFLDSPSLVHPVMCNWHKDGAHLYPGWYQLMGKYLLGMYCM